MAEDKTLARPDDVETLNQCIREGSPHALDMLAVLPSPCVVDAEGQSPFNVAIQADNAGVVNLLLDADGALEFAPAVHPKDRARLMKTIYRSEGIDDIELAERRVLEAVGVPMPLRSDSYSILRARRSTDLQLRKC